jgi:hypothetical protein
MIFHAPALIKLCEPPCVVRRHSCAERLRQSRDFRRHSVLRRHRKRTASRHLPAWADHAQIQDNPPPDRLVATLQNLKLEPQIISTVSKKRNNAWQTDFGKRHPESPGGRKSARCPLARAYPSSAPAGAPSPARGEGKTGSLCSVNPASVARQRGASYPAMLSRNPSSSPLAFEKPVPSPLREKVVAQRPDEGSPAQRAYAPPSFQLVAQV